MILTTTHRLVMVIDSAFFNLFSIFVCSSAIHCACFDFPDILDFLIVEAFEEETLLCSNRSANLIEEWLNESEDEVWKQGETQ